MKFPAGGTCSLFSQVQQKSQSWKFSAQYQSAKLSTHICGRRHDKRRNLWGMLSNLCWLLSNECFGNFLHYFYFASFSWIAAASRAGVGKFACSKFNFLHCQGPNFPIVAERKAPSSTNASVVHHMWPNGVFCQAFFKESTIFSAFLEYFTRYLTSDLCHNISQNHLGSHRLYIWGPEPGVAALGSKRWFMITYCNIILFLSSCHFSALSES